MGPDHAQQEAQQTRVGGHRGARGRLSIRLVAKLFVPSIKGTMKGETDSLIMARFVAMRAHKITFGGGGDTAAP